MRETGTRHLSWICEIMDGSLAFSSQESKS
jgi:hypothetical protein